MAAGAMPYRNLQAGDARLDRIGARNLPLRQMVRMALRHVTRLLHQATRIVGLALQGRQPHGELRSVGLATHEDLDAAVGEATGSLRLRPRSRGQVPGGTRIGSRLTRLRDNGVDRGLRLLRYGGDARDIGGRRLRAGGGGDHRGLAGLHPLFERHHGRGPSRRLGVHGRREAVHARTQLGTGHLHPLCMPLELGPELCNLLLHHAADLLSPWPRPQLPRDGLQALGAGGLPLLQSRAAVDEHGPCGGTLISPQRQLLAASVQPRDRLREILPQLCLDERGGQPR
mmetsp:Transcript_23136/g.66385  ORF Transcript_23136/g.66385 Transcript_23136/m.66385 type:complete len:285 (+) Transcript_23136:1674-2528(+)